jgi:hypothetical protein
LKTSEEKKFKMSHDEPTAEQAKQLLKSLWNMPQAEVDALTAPVIAEERQRAAARAVADDLVSRDHPLHDKLTTLAVMEARSGLQMCPKCHQRVSGMTKCPEEPWTYHVALFK